MDTPFAANIGIETPELQHPHQSAEELGAEVGAGAEGEEDGAGDCGGGGVEGGGFGEGEEGLDVGVGALEGWVLENVSRQKLARAGSRLDSCTYGPGEEER